MLEAIRHLDCSPEFGRRNFTPSSYTNSQNKKQPLYEITRDGFTFLCMGFTGPQAALWKERYIEAFNRMELALRSPAQHPVADLGLAREIGQLKDVVAAQNQAILALYQEVDGARRGHIRALTRLLSSQERQQKREAKETILRLEADGAGVGQVVQIQQLTHATSTESYKSLELLKILDGGQLPQVTFDVG